MGKAAQVEQLERLVHETVQRVDAIAPDALRALMPALREARDEMRKDLQRWLETAPDGADRFTAYHRTQALRSLEATFERIEELQPAMAGALGMSRAETGVLGVKNLEHEVQRLSAIFGKGHVVLPQIDTAAIIAKGDRLLWRRHENSARRYAGSLGDDVRHRLAVSLAKGDTFSQAQRRLLGSAEFVAMAKANDPGSVAFGIADATFARWRHWADRLVRTENMHAYNVQHDLAIEQVNADRHEDDDEYLRRWDATGDNIACPRCKELDRTLATIKGDFKGGVHSPPLHPYCRCVVLAWQARWGNFKGEVPARDHDGKDIAPTPDTPKERKPKPAPAPEPEQEQVIDATERKKNPKRVEAAKKAAAASAERRREIHSAVASNLPQELQVAWDEEGHKFMQQEAKRIRGMKDRINAASKISEAFAEQYGSGAETTFGNEGDRFHKRAEIEAKHAEHWADEQERKYYEAARREMERSGEIDERGGLTKRGRGRAAERHDWTPQATLPDDEDPPF